MTVIQRTRVPGNTVASIMDSEPRSLSVHELSPGSAILGYLSQQALDTKVHVLEGSGHLLTTDPSQANAKIDPTPVTALNRVNITPGTLFTVVAAADTLLEIGIELDQHKSIVWNQQRKPWSLATGERMIQIPPEMRDVFFGRPPGAYQDPLDPQSIEPLQGR